MVPSQGLKEALIREGITKMKILKGRVLYKRAHSGYLAQAIRSMNIQHQSSQLSLINWTFTNICFIILQVFFPEYKIQTILKVDIIWLAMLFRYNQPTKYDF